MTCKECLREIKVKAKGMCQNCWHKFKRKNQPEFYLRTRYTEIKQRCSNPNNTRADLYNGVEYCTKEEFLETFVNNNQFLKLFEEWKSSGWKNTLSPSIDRIDPKKGYTLDNIQVITHSHNCTKDQTMQEVLVYRGSDFVARFDSQSEASRELKIPQSNIWKVINGQRKTAGGYIFLGGDYKNA